MHTPSHFIVNDQQKSLLSRLLHTLEHAQYFDVLTGYFRVSGYHALVAQLEGVDKVRILVGLGIDTDTHDAVVIAQNPELDFHSSHQTQGIYKEQVKKELAEVEQSPIVEKSIHALLRGLQQTCADPEMDKKQDGNGKRIEIRAYKQRGLHAKVYIHRYRGGANKGCVITGSSNVSLTGLKHNLEFNVELRDDSDVEYALHRFEQLWAESVPVSELLQETVEKETWLREDITPYELFLKMLYEYFAEEINATYDNEDIYLPPGFMRLDYQLQAVQQAQKILEQHGGVFIADVVGLGKTYMAAMLLQQLNGRKLVICPPVLQENWREAIETFGVRSSKVESLGKLDKVLEAGAEKYDYVVVDEAHRFRNEDTLAYDQLKKICRGSKVILLSATPMNNRLDDFRAQLKLFIPIRSSNIPGLANLESFFNGESKKITEAQKALRDAKKGGDLESIPQLEEKLKATIRQVSARVKDRVLNHIMLRRTRTDIVKHFSQDMQNQGLRFPEVMEPEPVPYEFAGKVEEAFERTINRLTDYQYARYTPKLYLRKDITDFEKHSQRNIGAFMKGLLVKRLESSFHAFSQTVQRFISSTERFLEMYKAGKVYIGKDLKVLDAFESGDMSTLERWLENEEIEAYESKDFTPSFKKGLEDDLTILKAIQHLWSNVKEDPKLDALRQALSMDERLTGKIVLFTESMETASYLGDNLNKEHPGKVMFFSANGAIHGGEKLSLAEARNRIVLNYDPRVPKEKQQDSIRILLTTDVLSEGVNLHKSNVLINYDLPWNPTRLLQRAGRVNRIGSEHTRVHIFNFFPTSSADKHLGLKANITAKLQLFHNILGEDAKYLHEGEEVSSQELFNKVQSKAAYVGDEEEDGTLPYLSLIRRIRDEEKALYERIKSLPPKARVAYRSASSQETGLVTFFRQGALKRFFWATLQDETPSQELTFVEAAKLMESNPEEPRIPLRDSHHFYDRLTANREALEKATQQEHEVLPGINRMGSSHDATLLRMIPLWQKQHLSALTHADVDYVQRATHYIKQGNISKHSAKKLKDHFETPSKFNNLGASLAILRKEIDPKLFELEETSIVNPQSKAKRDVILSALVVTKNN